MNELTLVWRRRYLGHFIRDIDGKDMLHKMCQSICPITADAAHGCNNRYDLQIPINPIEETKSDGAAEDNTKPFSRLDENSMRFTENGRIA